MTFTRLLLTAFMTASLVGCSDNISDATDNAFNDNDYYSIIEDEGITLGHVTKQCEE